ncbi:MAG: hypothetical protein CM15mP84_11180 [Cellvibrionales bacterium]|nr:MAG: hypothetical protein CM15mP84_11180 [Cellvibrionales bacterium]
MFCTLVNTAGRSRAVHDFGEGSFSIKVRHHDIGKYLITIFSATPTVAPFLTKIWFTGASVRISPPCSFNAPANACEIAPIRLWLGPSTHVAVDVSHNVMQQNISRTG